MTVVAPSIENIKGSDGSLETVRAVVNAQRAVSSTIIHVNAITGFNGSIIGTTGAVDADGALTIRTQVFFGHLAGSDIEIDSFAPGYTDQGNEVGDILIIKPTTAWADEVAALLGVVHEDNGTLKDDVVGADQLLDDAVTTAKIAAKAVTGAKVDDNTITPLQMLGIDMFGVTAKQSGGTIPAAGSGQFYIQAGTTVGTFASNALDVSFPTAFPNGLLTIVITNGDSIGTDLVTISQGATTMSGFRAQCASNGSKRINWIAIGF